MEQTATTLPGAVETPSSPTEEPVRFFYMPRWSGPDGVRNILAVSIPLIVTNAVHAVNMFIDRMFLSWHDAEAFAAALQAGTLYWCIAVIFFHTVMYAGTLAAQFIGARQPQRVGPVTWQAVWFGLAGGMLYMAIGPFARPFFEWVGHPGNLPALEYEYFLILTFGSMPLFFNGALYGFFAGQSRTWTIFFVNAASCVVNFCLNAYMIFEPIGPFPGGIGGAAWASVFATLSGSLLFLLFMAANPENERRYKALSGWRFNPDLFRRLTRFGFPSGVHGFVDMIGFTTFLFVVGLFGMEAQFASNMAMNLNLVLFIPAIGIHMALGILAGQLCGARDTRAAERMTATTMYLLAIYMVFLCYLFIGIPEPLLQLFRGGMPEDQWQSYLGLAKTLLIFAAAYTIFDAFILVYAGTLKGAGDTRFVMKMSMVLSLTLLAGPNLVLGAMADRFENPRLGLYLSWSFCTLFLVTLGIVSAWRYKNGFWRTIDMVETEPVPVGIQDQSAVEDTAAKGTMPV